jgi:hypothetical protein
VEEDAPPDMNGLQAYCEACEFLGSHTLTIDNSINVDFMEVIEAGLTALGYKGTATLIAKGEDWTAPDIVITGIIQQVPLWRRLLDIIQLTRSKYK